MSIGGDEQNKTKESKAELFVLIALLCVFLAYSIFLAFKLDSVIIPDEPAHFIFSKHYSTTLGRPPDTLQTYSLGWYIEQNPFLYHWINGRIINLAQFINPTVTDATLLLILRLLSSLYSLGTLIFVYLLSKLIIHKAWWRLLPVFLLSNTLMFVFLSGGVNYDNLANLLGMAGMYYLIRVISGKDYMLNSLSWMIFICLACLVKFPMTPIALFAFIAWLVYSIKYRERIFPIRSWSSTNTILAIILLGLIFVNVSIYGYNLVVYHALTPRCLDLLNQSQCEIGVYAQRYKTYGLVKPMSVMEAIEKGFPHPLTYFFDFWLRDMFIKTHGIMGHKIYFSWHIVPFYRLFFLGVLCLAFLSWKSVKFPKGSLLFLILLYSMVVFVTNYKAELSYSFQHIAIQARYLFPIIGPVYVLVGYTLSQVSNKVLRFGSVVAAIVLFVIGGPLKFITLYKTIFIDWFIH